jgi:hypothetical protein
MVSTKDVAKNPLPEDLGAGRMLPPPHRSECGNNPARSFGKPTLTNRSPKLLVAQQLQLSLFAVTAALPPQLTSFR